MLLTASKNEDDGCKKIIVLYVTTGFVLACDYCDS